MDGVTDKWRLLVHSGADLPLIGNVRAGSESAEPWLLLGPDGEKIDEVAAWIRDLLLCDLSPRTARAYCFSLLTWYRVLWFCEVDWERATSLECAAMVAGCAGRGIPSDIDAQMRCRPAR